MFQASHKLRSKENQTTWPWGVWLSQLKREALNCCSEGINIKPLTALVLNYSLSHKRQMTQSPDKYSSRSLPLLASEMQESNSACAIYSGSTLQDMSQPVSLWLPCSQPLCSPGGEGSSDTEVWQATLYRGCRWLDHPFTCTPRVMVNTKRCCFLKHFTYSCSYWFFYFHKISA